MKQKISVLVLIAALLAPSLAAAADEVVKPAPPDPIVVGVSRGSITTVEGKSLDVTGGAYLNETAALNVARETKAIQLVNDDLRVKVALYCLAGLLGGGLIGFGVARLTKH